MNELELVIDEAEWEAVTKKVVPFCDDDERFGTGMIMVTADGSVRRWWATDRYRMARLDAAIDVRDFTLLVSPRLLSAWPLTAGDTGSATLRVGPSETGQIVSLTGAGGTFSAPLMPAEVSPLSQLSDDFDADDGPAITVDATGLHRLVTLATAAPHGPFLDDDHVSPPFRLSVNEHELRTTVDWAGLGEQTHRLPGSGTGSGEAVVNPGFVLSAVGVLDPGDVAVSVPSGNGTAIRVSQATLSVYLMPLDDSIGPRIAVESVLEECFGSDALHRDADDDYSLSVYGVPVFAHLIADEPALLRVFALVVRDVDPSPELLSELNALNGAYAFVKVVLHDRLLIVEGDLVAETLDAPELMALHERIRFVANELGPTLAAVYGGTGVEHGDATRWSTYTRTAVLAELSPGRVVDLSGPDAIEEWPFPDAVHVITAWNPFGRLRTADHNDDQNALLAADIVRAGGTALHAEGRSLDVDYGERSLLVWGLDTRTVIEIAASYDQEAVFRIDADQLEVLGVFQEQRAVRHRLEARATTS